MSWFCHTTSKKRSNKTRVGAAGRKSRRKEIERRPTFVVVVKNFTASLRDELSVHRGQVVEVVCTKGNLVYVRDMNSSVGYVPNDHTLDIERIEGTFSNVNIVNGENTILSGDNITGPAPHPRLIDVSTLQRSGSSVNSIEVHQVSDVAVTEVQGADEGKATPSSLSSQVIYEVPRYPNGMAVGTTMSKEDGGKAPALPPRSSCLPSLAGIQQGCTHDQNGHHHPRCLQQCRPSNLSLSSPSSANSYRTNCPRHPTPPRSRYPYGPFPPVSSDPASCKCHTASTPLNIHPYTPGFPPCTPGCSPPAWTPGSTPNRISPCGKKPISQSFSANVPGSALSMGSTGLPTSYTSANLASNPGTSDGSRDLTNQKIGYGFIIPSSSSPTSSVPPYRQRAKVRVQRNRRYSSDVQIQSTISENISNEAKISHEGDPLDTSRQYSRRRSQPCLVTDRTSTPGHQPQRHLFQLPVRRSLSLCGPSCVHAPTGHSSCPCTPLQKKQPLPISIHRAPSYKEAVLSDDVNASGETDVKPSEIDGNSIPCHSLESGPSSSVSQRPRSTSNLIDEDVTEISMCTPDHVLPSDVKKPVGIYRCLRMHKPKFKGEIALRKNEMVIVLDYGRGEWAWVMTSANIEGVVPKSVLAKYHPNGNGIICSDSNGEHLAVSVGISSKGTTTKGNGTESVLQARNGIDAATQTEAFHVPLSYHGSSRSASVGLSMGYSSSSSVPTNESSPLSTSLRAETSERKGQIGKKEVKAGIVLLEAAATAIVEHVKVQKKTHPRTTKEWFNTMDSLDEKDRIAPLGSHTSLILRQVDSCSPSQLETATAAESSQSSKEEAKVRAVAPATSETAMTTVKIAAATGGSTTTEVAKPATISYRDRISSLGSASFNNKIAASLLPVARSGKQRTRQLGLSNVLTVIRNYSPPPTAKNCLTIKEGDILHLQMHMHYPKGWMWVWHTTRRSFGYVPKSYIAYTYNAMKRQTPRNNIQEDAV